MQIFEYWLPLNCSMTSPVPSLLPPPKKRTSSRRKQPNYSLAGTHIISNPNALSPKMINVVFASSSIQTRQRRMERKHATAMPPLRRAHRTESRHVWRGGGGGGRKERRTLMFFKAATLISVEPRRYLVCKSRDGQTAEECAPPCARCAVLRSSCCHACCS